jgi:toxin ParE1/3/4
MVIIEFTPKAIDDIEITAIYISQTSEKYAQMFVETIFSEVNYLSKHPLIGRFVPEFEEDTTLRELIRPPYRIVYRIVSIERIDIIRVLRSSQNFLPEMFQ